jgi:hypothetical protein
MLCVVPDSAADNVYGDYIDRFVGSQLFRSNVGHWRRVEVMSPAMTVGGMVTRIRLFLLSAFIVLRCRHVPPAARVQAAGSTG